MGIPESIGGYQVLKELGRGATGTVYLCHQETLDRQVALKVLAPALTNEEEFVARFQRESKIAATLRHDHIVAVYDAGRCEDLFYIVMEMVGGRDLEEVMREKGQFSVPEAVAVTRQLLSALDYAHQKGVVHRDVKPANVLTRKDGNVALADFSLASMAGQSKLTKTGTVMGTLDYIAPETLEGDRPTPQADLYAVGLILYEMLTGNHPFRRESATEVIKAQLLEDPVRPEKLNSDIPEHVSAAVLKALAKKPEERFESAAEMSAALQFERTSVSQFVRGVERGEVSLDEAARVHQRLRESEARTRPIEAPTPARKSGVLAVVGVLLVLLMVGQGWPGKIDLEAATPQILAAQEELDELVSKRQGPSQYFADDFVFVRENGERLNLEKFGRQTKVQLDLIGLESVRTEPLGPPRVEGRRVVVDNQATIRGKKAVVRMKVRVSWVRRQGRWQVVGLKILEGQNP